MQTDWDVQHYTLDVHIDLDALEVEATTQLTARARSQHPGALLLHAEVEEVTGVWVEGVEVTPALSAGQLQIPMSEASQDQEVLVTYRSKINQGSDYGLSLEDGVLFSFHEPRGARNWLVVYDDPADKATLEWRITVPSDLVVAANGNLVSNETEGDETTWVFSMDQPIATYLMALHASEYAILEQETQDGLPIRHYIHQGTQGAAWNTLGSTPEILELFSDLFGDYPFERYGNAVAPMGGAMEHTTIVTFGSSLIGGGYGELVNAHEAAHHWWGDYVTLADWPEIWLNEGFASYGEVLWNESKYGEEGRRSYVEEQKDSYFTWKDWEGEFSLYDPDYMWGGTIYDKGSVVLDMLRTLVGDESFFAALRRYGADNAYGVVTTADLEAAFETETQEDLGWFFDQWVI